MNSRTEALKPEPVSGTLYPVPGLAGQCAISKQTKVAKRLPSAANAMLSMLDHIIEGRIIITLPDGRQHSCGRQESGPIIDMSIHDWRVFGEIIARGDIGAAECFIDGLWSTDSLPELLTLFAQNRQVLENAIHGRRWKLLGAWVLHHLRANTRRGSKRNIMAHYDLGNDFYRLWLDDTMTYSSALFAEHTHPDAAQWGDLPSAQRAKNDRMIRALNLQPGDRVLEVGCGWGGFAEQAALCGVHVTGLTLSPAQRAFAQARAEHGGWQDSADFQLMDYRDMRGQFDQIVSVEMFEAVGERWWPTYFSTLKRLLKPSGRAVIQVITIDDRLFHQYRRSTDFIQRHVFPGGMLPSPHIFCSQAVRAGFTVTDDLAFGPHYARTLELWHKCFNDRLNEVRAQKFDDRFIRLWRFYLAYCEAGFRAGSVDVHQYTLQT